MQSELGWWFRQKYNLPPNDPRYLSLTHDELVTEYYAHLYAEKQVRFEDEDEDFDLNEVLRQYEEEAEADGDGDQWEEVDLDTEDRS